ncbi:MAG: N-acetylglucosamine kinase [Coraliomargarita sp.]
MAFFLGVDGGGTQTRALLVDLDATIIAEAKAGPSNINQVNTTILRRRLRELCAEVLDSHEPVYACFGLAGSSAVTNQAKLRAMLDGIPNLHTDSTALCTDADIALHGAFGGAPGLALIAGTGSICIGTTHSTETIRIGGWAPPSGDPGSGHSIGNVAIATALKQADGRSPKTGLLEVVFNHLQIQNLGQATERVHTTGLTREKIAALCPKVCRSAEDGDIAAKEIVREAVSELSEMVQAARNQYEEREVPLCLMGGILNTDTIIRRQLIDQLPDLVSRTQIQKPQLPAIGGAILRAYELYSKQPITRFAKRLSHQLASR